MLGQNPPAGSAWRQTQALLNESHSLFEIMTENKGLHIERMLRMYVLPFIKKKLKNSKELVARLEANDIKKIDGIYVKNEAIKKTKEDIKNKILTTGEVPSVEEQESMIADNSKQIQEDMNLQDNVRTFKPSEISDKTWDEIFEDLEWDVKVNITGEASNDNDMVATLTTVLQTIGSNPQALQNPAFALVFNRVLSLTGALNPIELDQTIKETQNTVPPSPTGEVGVEQLSVNEQ